jgi:hypothetical protein
MAKTRMLKTRKMAKREIFYTCTPQKTPLGWRTEGRRPSDDGCPTEAGFVEYTWTGTA